MIWEVFVYLCQNAKQGKITLCDYGVIARIHSWTLAKSAPSLAENCSCKASVNFSAVSLDKI